MPNINFQIAEVIYFFIRYQAQGGATKIKSKQFSEFGSQTTNHRFSIRMKMRQAKDVKIICLPVTALSFPNSREMTTLIIPRSQDFFTPHHSRGNLLIQTCNLSDLNTKGRLIKTFHCSPNIYRYVNPKLLNRSYFNIDLNAHWFWLAFYSDVLWLR